MAGPGPLVSFVHSNHVTVQSTVGKSGGGGWNMVTPPHLTQIRDPLLFPLRSL